MSTNIATKAVMKFRFFWLLLTTILLFSNLTLLWMCNLGHLERQKLIKLFFSLFITNVFSPYSLSKILFSRISDSCKMYSVHRKICVENIANTWKKYSSVFNSISSIVVFGSRIEPAMQTVGIDEILQNDCKGRLVSTKGNSVVYIVCRKDPQLPLFT